MEKRRKMMGYYINYNSLGNPLPEIHKDKFLIRNEGATKIDEPKTFTEGIVCVAEIGYRQVAIYICSAKELYEVKAIKQTNKVWLKLDSEKAKKLANY